LHVPVDLVEHQLNGAVFRNESPILSSVLIREACELAWRRWPGARLYTYVDARRVRSPNPGCCFKAAGWRACGKTKCRRLLILESLPAACRSPEAPSRAVPPGAALDESDNAAARSWRPKSQV
jgi:hypothetical protein